MMSTQNDKTPCDGKIPASWNLPDLNGLVEVHPGYISADFRSLSAPAPLVATLKILTHLQADQYLSCWYPKTPLHLFPHLREDGWSWEILEEKPGGVRVKIFRKGPTP